MIVEKERRIYMSDAEWKKAKRLAKASGRSVSAYFRSLLNLKIPKPIPPESYRELYRELSAIGNNVNQMAKLAHSKGSAEYIHFAKALETIYSIQRQLIALATPEDIT
ncbi:MULTISPECIES: MobC family plasmid mobilization relaxosome protein [Clostridia]|uniref:MobC family plasmid mobilization relaxosome protein n=1 Tax=Clostridia TaxID=186801 RepID=UPI0025B882E7|nr:MobC family plasmid mobilization relaxosome protein [Blautia sp.]